MFFHCTIFTIVVYCCGWNIQQHEIVSLQKTVGKHYHNKKSNISPKLSYRNRRRRGELSNIHFFLPKKMSYPMYILYSGGLRGRKRAIKSYPKAQRNFTISSTHQYKTKVGWLAGLLPYMMQAHFWFQNLSVLECDRKKYFICVIEPTLYYEIFQDHLEFSVEGPLACISDSKFE